MALTSVQKIITGSIFNIKEERNLNPKRRKKASRSLSNILDKLARKLLLRRLPQRGSSSIPCLQLIVFQQPFCSATGRLAKCVSKEKNI